MQIRKQYAHYKSIQLRTNYSSMMFEADDRVTTYLGNLKKNSRLTAGHRNVGECVRIKKWIGNIMAPIRAVSKAK